MSMIFLALSFFRTTQVLIQHLKFYHSRYVNETVCVINDMEKYEVHICFIKKESTLAA